MSPLNRKLTSGGSSGGESALISFGGSVLGVGTDIGELRTVYFPRTRDYCIEPIEMHSVFQKRAMSTERSTFEVSLWPLARFVKTLCI